VIDPSARGAWRALEAQLRPFVARRVRADADVDDVLQDVFLRMQRGVGALREEERFGPWVYQVVRSAIAEHRRASARRGALIDDGADALEPCAPDGYEEPVYGAERVLASVIAPFVDALPEPYSGALRLVELEGLTHREAAARLGISLSGMKSRVQRGRAMLRRALEDCCHVELDARGHVVDVAPRPDGRMPARCCA
jgi:RNA polymerase sigma-70 factor (ECF subfamily)